MDISKYNHERLELVKSLVQANPIISDEEVYNKVIDWINNTRFEDYTSYTFDKKTGQKVYATARPIAASGKAYKDLELDLIQEAAQYRTFDKVYSNWVDNWNPNPYKFTKAVSKLFFNINNNEEALENIRKFFANIQYNMGNSHFTPQQSMLYLVSECVGGVGKGHFLNKLKDWCNKHNLKNTTFKFEPNWVSSVYSTNLIGISEEYTPNYRVSADDINPIIDNTDYQSRVKMMNSVNLPSRITMVVGSNYLPTDRKCKKIWNS